MNKKLIATLVLSTAMASSFALNAGAATDKQVLKDDKGTVHNIVGKLGKVSGVSAEDRAFAALDKVKSDLGFVKATDNFKVKTTHKDENGTSHTKMDQVINGIVVFGKQVIVHETDGDVTGVTSSFQALNADADRASLTEAQAIERAVTGATPDTAPTAELVYLPQGDQAVLSYKVSYSVINASEPAIYDVYVSAVDGSIVEKINKIQHTAAVGTGVGTLGKTISLNTNYRNGTYYLEDITKPMFSATSATGMIRTFDMKNGTYYIYSMTDADNVWNMSNQRAGVDANYHAGLVYDWYLNNVNRNSIDDNGMSIESAVHYSTSYNNAFWDGTNSFMIYGDGDGITFRSLAAGLDIVAHELTHGVTQYTSGLINSNQSGALNESWSDAIASAIDDNDWLIGEDVYTPATSGDALRSMSYPPAYGQPEHISNYVLNGSVHINSGIPNKAFYNFATAIGNRTIAGKIWYTASRDYMTSSTDFAGARVATLQATAALYGADHIYYTYLQNAWSAVGIY